MSPGPGRPKPLPLLRQGGFTLIEIIVVTVILSMVSLASLSLTVSSFALESVNREMSDATAVARRVLEEMEALPFEELFARLNSDPTDDPGGAGTAPGNLIQVPAEHVGGLLGQEAAVLPISIAASGPVEGLRNRRDLDLEIILPTDPAGQLIETETRPAWGNQTWDLDGDGAITGDDKSDQYKILPVVVRVTWNGASGPQALELARILTRK
jgi:prepilin-type N-terminal cleavage/methylation domain-containing protein